MQKRPGGSRGTSNFGNSMGDAAPSPAFAQYFHHCADKKLPAHCSDKKFDPTPLTSLLMFNIELNVFRSCYRSDIFVKSPFAQINQPCQLFLRQETNCILCHSLHVIIIIKCFHLFFVVLLVLNFHVKGARGATALEPPMQMRSNNCLNWSFWFNHI